ncbi:E3 ubiquitin-protein ligase LRSAM1-like isoform X2 [Argiope bruennichi]|uniref:E3 ubiquitin-protein ligase LRSAM1-like isoform X2 n=1 Tax=Argiope bruennichi TaxID=94029 RepID=UPI002494B715|nr:E3 ubiquitin-protein ligase LRSAM1-like isoform X2 [Argiope bruennichi]
MPFWNDSKAQNYKAKLEHKMCIAKEAPDENFDLSDCNLSEIPPGVFSMCRVFRKEALLLQNNHISNLSSGGSLKDLSQLQILNLRNNKLSSLPSDISHLSKLKVLDLESNQLKKLPASFEKLTSLCHLNLKSNKLSQFPVPICSLHSLEYLNLCDNPKIKYLPKELCNLTSLKDLEINSENFIYPSADICLSGTENIMKFLCEAGADYAPPTPKSLSSAATPDEEHSEPDRLKSMDFSPLSASYLHYQRAKERRQQELIVMEEALKENFAVQSSINANSSERRKKLLEDIALEQDRMESEIMLLQTKKDKEKKNLLDVLTNIENHSAKLIDQLMLLNDRTKQVEKMAAVLERDRIENEEIFSIKQEKLEQLKKKEILEAMTEMLKCEETYGKYEAEKSLIVEQLQNEETESNFKLYNIFQERELDQQILINRLLEEEQYQKEAFEALQLQKDIQHQEIAHQIHLIEKELSNLTVAEIKKKDLKIDSEMNVLADHRIALASLLSDLMAAKEQRELELKERLQQMELKRAQEIEDFWLIQYQKLLDRKPKGVIGAELGLDKDVKSILLDIPAIEYLPLFASKRISLSTLLNFTTKDLKKMGILDDEICEAILDKAQEYFKNMQAEEKYSLPEFSEVPVPSAPPEPSTPTEPEEILSEPTAPPLSPDDDTKLWCQTECVICLDVQTSSVFLPCGHVCCCRDCSKKVELCPMCRTTISSRFILTVS